MKKLTVTLLSFFCLALTYAQTVPATHLQIHGDMNFNGRVMNGVHNDSTLNSIDSTKFVTEWAIYYFLTHHQGAGGTFTQSASDWNSTTLPTKILNKPTIPAAQVNSDWTAGSGIAQILNKPTIPAAQVNSDWNANSGIAQVLNKPTIYTKAQSDSITALYYKKAQSDSLFALYYKKGQVDSIISHLSLSAYYTKTQVDSIVATLSFTNYYTKAQTDSIAGIKDTVGLGPALVGHYNPTTHKDSIAFNPGVSNGITYDPVTGVISYSGPSGGGTVTLVSATGPLHVTNGSTTPLIAIDQANTSQDGWLSAMDWNNFNAKLSSVDTTNIPDFVGKVRSLFSAAGPVTYVNGLIGMPQANGSTNGYLSATDWTRFNAAKANADSTAQSGYVTHWQDDTAKANLRGAIAGKLDKSDSTLANRITSNTSILATHTTQIATNSTNITQNTADILNRYDSIRRVGLQWQGRKNGNWYNVGTDSVGASIDTTKFLSTGSTLGTLFQKSNLVSTDYTAVGSPTVSVASGDVTITSSFKSISNVVGTSNGAISQWYDLTSYGATGLQRTYKEDTLIFTTTPSATTGGVGVARHSIVAGNISNAIAYLNTSTNAGAGTLSILLGINNTTAAITANALTLSNTDSFSISLRNVDNNWVAIATDISTKKSISCQASVDYSSSTLFPLQPNTGYFSLALFGGTTKLLGENITSDETKNPAVCVIGDSKLWYSAAEGLSTASLLKKYSQNQIVLHGGQGNKTSESVAQLREDSLINATTYILETSGRNDTAALISQSVRQANVDSIYNYIVNKLGKKIAIIDGLFETTVNQSSAVAYIDSKYSSVAIRAYDETNYTGFVNIDNIHPSVLGHKNLADFIWASPLLSFSKISPQGKLLNNSQDGGFVNLHYYGNIFDDSRSFTPDTYGGHDWIIAAGAAIASASNTSTQKNKFIVNNGNGRMELRAYYAGTGIDFYGTGGTTGSQARIMSIQDGTVAVVALGSAQKPTTSPGGMSFYVPNNGEFASNISANDITVAGYRPIGTSNVSRFFNHNSNGSYAFSVPNGTAGAEVDMVKIDSVGRIQFQGTITTLGTDGAQTINKTSGIVNFAAAGSTLVVTNSQVTANSLIFVQVLGTDATATTARVTRSTGSFTITLNAAATAETSVEFWVMDKF